MIINLKNTVNTGPDLQHFPNNKVVNSIIPVRAGYGIPRYTLQKTGQKNIRLGDAVPKSYPIFYPIIHMNHYESIFSHIDCPILVHVNPYFIPYKIIFIHIFQRFFFSRRKPCLPGSFFATLLLILLLFVMLWMRNSPGLKSGVVPWTGGRFS